MGKKIDITLNFNPANIHTAQQKGVRIVHGRPWFYKKSKVAKSENALKSAILSAMRENGISDPSGMFASHEPLTVTIEYAFPFRKAEAAKLTKNGVAQIPMVERPDVDNLTKSLLDILCDLKIFPDDAQIVQLELRKFRTASEYVRIRIEENNFHT